jgi:Type I phosphodiesterase / nucleotide pyrophosphatase
VRHAQILCFALAGALALAGAAAARAGEAPHNLVLFVADGLRGLIVDDKTAPAMAALRDRGVYFPNSHALFPTFTTPNASALATGHDLGDTGDFSNTLYAGFPVRGAGNSVTPFLESDPVLGDIDAHFAGNYLDEITVLKAAADKGYSTATIGKLGPALIFAHTDRAAGATTVLDDSTGTPAGIPLSKELSDRLAAAGLPLAAPSRGANGRAGTSTRPGTASANIAQQDYFVDAAAKAVLPLFKARGKPFMLVFWSRDPDGTQHNQGDSLNKLTPGINGSTSMAAIANADRDLARLQAALEALGLAPTTDIIVTSDHGFATISKQSRTSGAAKGRYRGVPAGFLPPGFLAIDLAQALGLPLFDPDAKDAAVPPGAHSSRGNGLLGPDPLHPDVVIAANGGSDLVYLPKKDKTLARRILRALLQQDYTGGLFVDDDLGRYPGTLPLSTIALKGSAITPMPAIVVSFRSFSTGCARPTNCMAEIADTGLQQGQGMHGSFGRGDVLNFMAASGPDFKHGFIDTAPVSNADIGVTAARLLALDIPAKGRLLGRVIEEALPGKPAPKFTAGTRRSAPAAGGMRMVLIYQRVGTTRYFDAAGFPGRTLGLPE